MRKNETNLRPLLKIVLFGAVFWELLIFGVAFGEEIWEKRNLQLSGRYYELSLPRGFGPLRGGGDSSAASAFQLNNRPGQMVITATKLSDVKIELEKQGLPAGDWLLNGLLSDNPLAIAAGESLAKSAGFLHAAIENVGTQKALVYEAPFSEGLSVVAVSILMNEMITLSLSVQGEGDAAQQREWVRQILGSLQEISIQSYAIHGKSLQTPLAWESLSTLNQETFTWRWQLNGQKAWAAVCAATFQADTNAPSEIQLLLKEMLLKQQTAGLAGDDGLVRLFERKEGTNAFWIAVWIAEDIPWVCGVYGESTMAREAVEQLARGFSFMAGSGKIFAVVQ